MTRGQRIVLTSLLALLAIASSGQAYPESEAAQFHPDIVTAWHEPQTVTPGTQWEGFLKLREGHAILAASYQICFLGDATRCFAPPTAAEFVDETTLRFDTNNYLANGQPVNWKAGWRVGIHWHLDDGSEAGAWIPRGPPAPGEVVAPEDLYLTFDIPSEPRGAPSISATAILASLGLVAALRRR